MAKILWHATISPDGIVADPDDAMERVSEYPEPNASVEEVMQTTGPAPDGSPDGSSECRRLDAGLTARHRRATAPTSETVNVCRRSREQPVGPQGSLPPQSTFWRMSVHPSPLYKGERGPKRRREEC